MTTVCITGMHRSGTSMLARIVNLLGVHLGDEDSHVSPNEGNPTGYWENRRIVRINNEILAHFGGDWAGVPRLPTGWEHDETLSPLRSDARREIARLRERSSLIGFKDPRFCLLLPFWRQITPIDRVIASVRPPLAVAQSLERRNSLGEAHVASLHTRYVSALATNAPELVLFDYQELMAGSSRLVTKVAKHLGVAPPTPKTMEAIAAFVRPEIDHSEGRDERTPELRFAEEVHARLAELPDGRPWLIAVAGTLNEIAGSDGRAPGGIGARPTRLASLTRERDAERERRAELAMRNADLEAAITELRSDLDRLCRDHDRLHSRRSVRFALALANRARPLVRGARFVKRVVAPRRA